MDRRKAPFNTVKYHQIVSCMCLLTITGKHCYCEIFLTSFSPAFEHLSLWLHLHQRLGVLWGYEAPMLEKFELLSCNSKAGCIQRISLLWQGISNISQMRNSVQSILAKLSNRLFLPSCLRSDPRWSSSRCRLSPFISSAGLQHEVIIMLII